MSDSATPWTVALQAPQSMGSSRQEYWSRLPCSPPGDLPNAEIEPTSLLSSALIGGFFTTSATWGNPESLGITINNFSKLSVPYALIFFFFFLFSFEQSVFTTMINLEEAR